MKLFQERILEIMTDFIVRPVRGYSKSFLEPKVNNRTVTVRHERDARLKPEMIATIQMGCVLL